MKIKNELTLLIEQIFKTDIVGAKIHIIRWKNSVPKKNSKIQKKSVRIQNRRKNVIKKRMFVFTLYLLCSNATKTKRNMTSADLTEKQKNIEKSEKEKNEARINSIRCQFFRTSS